MQIKTTRFEDNVYPKFITEGNHTQYIKPIADKICIGHGLDITVDRTSWKLSNNCIGIDIAEDWDRENIDRNEEGFIDCSATCIHDIKEESQDFVFSSHALEHVTDYVRAFRYWTSLIKPGGVMVLYLPHPDCKYWLPWKMETERHKHHFYPEVIESLFDKSIYENIFVSGRDTAYSFCVYGNKKWT